MAVEIWQHLDEHLRLRLADLPPRRFELFFLDFLNAGVALAIQRDGREMTKRIITASTYAPGGHPQDGIDLCAEVEGGEVWAFQCKRVKKWDLAKTREALSTVRFKAHHYFLIVTCAPPKSVHDELKQNPRWSLWNLDTLCSQIKHRVHPSKLVAVLSFLSPDELKRFVPFTTEALLGADRFFDRFLGSDKFFRHDWTLVGRSGELHALQDFIASPRKVQLLSAKGGDGKSRLVWELCRKLTTQAPETEIWCLNPHRSGDDFEFAFTGAPARRLIIVDDAHRAEQVPLPLLSLVRQDATAKILLATRPQGVEALADKLFESGLANELPPCITLPHLRRTEVKTLALEALGQEQAAHAQELADLTADSPFLTVVAGELVRTGRLAWGAWTNHDEFRQHAFCEFDQKNLETIPEADRQIAHGLMRLLALLAPAAIDSKFADKAGRCLGCSSFVVETHLNRLRESEVVAGREDGLRIVPDLFADFLVYDTCYGRNRRPNFVRRVLEEYQDRSAALVRNLSEATWVARANGIADEALLEAVLGPERRTFQAASFYQRAEMLRHWSAFSIYLPKESLEFAKIAMALATAPEDPVEQLLVGLWKCDHGHVSDQIPALLKPVAKYHDAQRHAALDLLWDLGLTQPWASAGSNQNHAWAVIAEVIKFEPNKPMAVTLDALRWLGQRLRKPETLKAVEDSRPVLKALLGACFTREVEFTRWEGRTCHFCRQLVAVRNTEPIRRLALELLEWVVETGSSLAALDALAALQGAVEPGFFPGGRPSDDAFRAKWLPERIKALALYEKALARHSSVAVRYEIRRTLQQVISNDEDREFEKACRAVLAKVSEDTDLKVAEVILAQGGFDFEDGVRVSGGEDWHSGRQRAWEQSVREAARQLAATCPEVPALIGFLQQLVSELARAGYHPFLRPLFGEFAQVAPALAVGLANHILDANGETPLAREWPALVEANRQIQERTRVELYRKAVGGQIEGARAAVVRVMTARVRRDQILDETERALLIDIAGRAGKEEGWALLQLVTWCGETNLPWGYQILQALRIRDIAPDLLRSVLQALVPYQKRSSPPPQDVIVHVLNELFAVPDLNRFDCDREWGILAQNYPRDVYHMIRERITYSASGNAPAAYNPILRNRRGQLSLRSLANEPDYPAICDDLWNRVSDPTAPGAYAWAHLFQAVVFEDPTSWPPRMLAAIAKAESEEALAWLAFLLKFEGSLIIFRFPEITRAFLNRAQLVGGDELCRNFRFELYLGCGPQTRMYSEGVLNTECDYVEAEAAKAAEKHASDELLGPFYRWIAEVEQKERLIHKLRAADQISCFD